MVLDKLEVQIKKNKQKSRDYRAKGKTAPPTVEQTVMDPAGQVRVQIHHIEYKPMDVDEAVMQMDLIKDNFLVFTNARTDAVNVLYRQKDGNYGLIQPRS
jgi:putative sigma-54 modulation protein